MTEQRVAKIIFALVCCAYFVRSFFGVSIGDEALLVAIADFPRLGARWFVDEMSVQTTGSILISPFISLYTALFGTTGVFLFSRLLYFVVSVAAALATARFFARYTHPPAALLLGALMVAYVPHGMSCLSYNSIGMMFFGLGTMLTLSGIFDQNRKQCFWGGFCWVIGVFAYPTAIITFGVFCLSLALLFLRRKELLGGFIKPFFIGLTVPSAVLIGVLLSCGIGNILKAVELSKHFNLPFDLIKLPDAIAVYISYWPPWWLTVPLMAAWLVSIVKFPRWSAWGFAVLLLAYIFLGGTGEKAYLQAMWPIAETMVLPGLILAWRGLDKNSRAPVLHFFIPAVFGSLIAMMTSRLTVYNMAGTAIFATMVGAAVLSRKDKWAAWATALTLLGFTCYSQWPRLYEDDVITKLDFEMKDGPFKYLRTNQHKGGAINTIQAEVKHLPLNGTILFQDHFPAGYLMTELRPLGPTINILPMFLHPEARPIFLKMFTENKAYWPDYVVELRGFPMSAKHAYYYRDNLTEWPTSEKMKGDPFYNFFVLHGAYKLVKDFNLFRILKRP